MTVTKIRIQLLMVQHYLIVSVSFLKYPRDTLRQTSPDVRFLNELRVCIWQSWDFGWRTPLLTPVNKQTTLDRLTANCLTVGNRCPLQPNAAGFILIGMYKLAVSYSIPTSSRLYIPLDLTLPFIIIFRFNSTPANQGYTHTSHRWERTQIEPIDGRFIQFFPLWHTAISQMPESPQ